LRRRKNLSSARASSDTSTDRLVATTYSGSSRAVYAVLNGTNTSALLNPSPNMPLSTRASTTPITTNRRLPISTDWPTGSRSRPSLS
jgi:hypothetical protein